MRISEGQKRIAESDAKHILVVASAGCGKTTALTAYAQRHIGGERSPRQVVLAFSNKAANDVKIRMGENVPGHSDRIYIGTIHQFCYDIVMKYGHLIGLGHNIQVFESLDDRLALFSESILSLPDIRSKLDGLSDKERDEVVSSMYRELSMSKKTMRNLSESLMDLYREYSDRLMSMNAMDFDDIILYAHRILVENESVVRIYRTFYDGICIDEAQDLNIAQYEFVKALAGDSMRIIMVGDPKQAIYGFAGASSDIMCEKYPSDYGDVTVFELKDNYRSSRKVIEAARVIDPRYDPDKHVPIEGGFELHYFSDEEEQAVWVADEIIRLTTEGHESVDEPMEQEDICVISRNRYGLNSISKELERRGIAYTIKTSAMEKSFDSDVFEALWLGARVVINPSDTFHLRALNSILGSNIDSTFPPECDDGESLSYMAGFWREMKSQLAANSFVPGRLNPFLDSLSSLQADEKERFSFDRDRDVWDSFVRRYIRNTRMSARSMNGLVTEFAMGSLENIGDRGVVLSTVHLTKGLEYDAVFVISVNDGMFPSYHAKTREQFDEERHNMFVAVTRSRRVCYVTCADIFKSRRGSIRRKPSVFYTELANSFPSHDHRYMDREHDHPLPGHREASTPDIDLVLDLNIHLWERCAIMWSIDMLWW